MGAMRVHFRETRASESGEQREARLEQTRLHARKTRASEGGEQSKAETDCSTSQCYVEPWTSIDINVQHHTVQVNMQATSNPVIFLQSLVCQAFLYFKYIYTFFLSLWL